jgi:UDP-glucose 4-epimerase
MKCVVMGGAGFMGSHLSEALLADGNDVTIFDRPQAPYFAQLMRTGVHAIGGDFLNPEDLDHAITGCDVIYHLVSTTVPQTSIEDTLFDVETNIVGTLRLLEAARKAKIQKIVFTSSGGTVYGTPQEIPIKENHPTDPTSSYGICKLTIEKYLHLYWTLFGLNYCILRISNAYGERQPTHGTQGVIAAFLNEAIHKDEIVIWGDGSVIRDYVYVGDVARALVTAAKYQGEQKIFNIGSGHGHSLNDIIGIIEGICRYPLQTKYSPGRPFDVPINILDISRARIYLQWQPATRLIEGISHTYEWMLHSPEENT